ncbi:outer membrane protein [Roseovarius sp. M141]|uniref:outer membrane protein n=1 Tax=Roseovarius sp. M141 TaxID=2583806 RepID=UPI0020CB74CA|nr:outer membrane beta-barrel protein [Roseovarius sp. M141]MCQ0093556.1 porin family protein [Roseovarius sp. M141]
MKYLLSAAAASALMAGTAFAGNIEPAPVEAVIVPAAPVFASPNWTGFYAGGQLGYANVDGDGVDNNGTPLIPGDDFPFTANGDGFIGGLVAGYDYDLGDWVIGAGFDYDWTDITLGGSPVSVESVWRAKLRGGYKFGNGLLYATGGYANADTNLVGDSDGWFIGAGYEHMLTQNFSLGGEVLYHQFDDFSNPAAGVASYDADVTTAQVRATFRF